MGCLGLDGEAPQNKKWFLRRKRMRLKVNCALVYMNYCIPPLAPAHFRAFLWSENDRSSFAL